MPTVPVQAPHAPVPPLLAAIASETPRIKLRAIKSLRDASVESPEALYHHFDFFADMLRAEHSILRWNAILIVGNLAAVDRERKIDALLDRYLAPIAGPLLIDAANTIRGASAIAAVRPDLADRIAARILDVERAVYATPECRNVAIGHALVALEGIFPMLDNPAPVLRFAEGQLQNTRSATRKKAERFLARRG